MSLVGPQMGWSASSFYDDSVFEPPLVPNLQQEQSPVTSLPLAFPNVEHLGPVAHHHETASEAAGPSTGSAMAGQLAILGGSGFRPSEYMFSRQLRQALPISQDECSTTQFKK